MVDENIRRVLEEIDGLSIPIGDPTSRVSPKRAAEEERTFLKQYVLDHGDPRERVDSSIHGGDIYDAIHAEITSEELRESYPPKR